MYIMYTRGCFCIKYTPKTFFLIREWGLFLKNPIFRLIYTEYITKWNWMEKKNIFGSINMLFIKRILCIEKFTFKEKHLIDISFVNLDLHILNSCFEYLRNQKERQGQMKHVERSVEIFHPILSFTIFHFIHSNLILRPNVSFQVYNFSIMHKFFRYNWDS